MVSTALPTRYKLIFFVPPQHLATCRNAVLTAGAGAYPAYSEVCFVTPVVGQFRPGDTANPAIGHKGELQEVGEVRCETTCNGKEITQAAVAALKKVHPYEVPVYEVYKLEDF